MFVFRLSPRFTSSAKLMTSGVFFPAGMSTVFSPAVLWVSPCTFVLSHRMHLTQLDHVVKAGGRPVFRALVSRFDVDDATRYLLCVSSL